MAKPMKSLIVSVAAAILSTGSLFAQEDLEPIRKQSPMLAVSARGRHPQWFLDRFLRIDPYAETQVDAHAHGLRSISLQSAERNVVSTNLAELSPGLEVYVANMMFLWVKPKAGGPHTIEWDLNLAEAGEYAVDAVLKAADCKTTIDVNGQTTKHTVNAKKWNRVSLGSVALKAGSNRLRLTLESQQPFELSALELARPQVKQEITADALSVRQTPDWFRDAGHGLMFQWTNRATPPKGSIKPWEQKVDDFDLDSLVQLVDDSGASFVVWSITWGQQYLAAPTKALDDIVPGRTTRRDLLGEMADRLHAKGVRLIFYYHYGYDCYHSKDPEWMTAAGGYEVDKSRFYGNVMEILSEVGDRYGEKLDGWFFDGGQRYYNCHYDGSDSVGISSAPFKRIGQAARNGNCERVLCYNPWILPQLTQYQDYFAGEGSTGATGLKDGVFTHGGQKGLMAFGCFPLERRWGHIDKNTPIQAPRVDAVTLARRITRAEKNRHPLAINLEMYEDGSVSPVSAALLKEVRAKLGHRNRSRP
jgi:alpha-L-fucosidase-like protein